MRKVTITAEEDSHGWLAFVAPSEAGVVGVGATLREAVENALAGHAHERGDNAVSASVRDGGDIRAPSQ